MHASNAVCNLQSLCLFLGRPHHNKNGIRGQLGFVNQVWASERLRPAHRIWRFSANGFGTNRHSVLWPNKFLNNRDAIGGSSYFVAAMKFTSLSCIRLSFKLEFRVKIMMFSISSSAFNLPSLRALNSKIEIIVKWLAGHAAYVGRYINLDKKKFDPYTCSILDQETCCSEDHLADCRANDPCWRACEVSVNESL